MCICLKNNEQYNKKEIIEMNCIELLFEEYKQIEI